MDGKIGIILVNTGSPEEPTPEAVRTYLARFLMDPRLVSVPRPIWRCILHYFILPRRSGVSANKYKLIWEDEGTQQGSPLFRAHLATARGLVSLLAGADVPVRAAFCYESPTVEEVMRELREEGCGRLVYLPLYPQSAYTQVGCCIDAFGKACRSIGWDPPVELIADFWEDEVYLRAVADSIVASGFDPEEDYLDLSYHAVPLRDIDHGDSYVDAVYQTNRRLSQMLGLHEGRWATGFQSVFGLRPQDWTAPLSTKILADWGAEGVRSVFFCCPGFAADCLETLYDVPYSMEPAYRLAYQEAHPEGHAPSFTYIPCLDADEVYPRILRHVLSQRSEFLHDILASGHAG